MARVYRQCTALLSAAAAGFLVGMLFFQSHQTAFLLSSAQQPATMDRMDVITYAGPDPNTKLDHRESKLVQPDLTLTRGHSMTLTMHMSSKPGLVENLLCIILRSVTTFWPRKFGKICLIMDEESTEDHNFAAKLKELEESLGVMFDIKYQPLPENAAMLNRAWKRERGPGYHRQMWNTYFLDVYINTSVIAYTDTDVMFSSPVTPESIFNGDKLRVYGATKWLNSSQVRGLDQATYTAIGKKMVAHCDPFPTYLWRDTVTNCRKHILKHLKVTSFEDAFLKIHGPQLVANPIKIINTYAYYFEHDRYDWHFQIKPKLLPDYNKIHAARGFYIQPKDTLPTLSLTTHKPNLEKESPFKQGYCIAMRHIGTLPAWCKAFENTTDFQLFVLGCERRLDAEGWCSGDRGPAQCSEMSESHYKTIAKYHKTGLYDFDIEQLSTVEKFAAKMNITCPQIMKPPLWSPRNISIG